MEKQNITLSIRKETLQKIKLIAVQKNTSVSAMVSRVLDEIVAQEDSYQAAQQRHTHLLKEGSDLGTFGEISWSRDDLHER